MKTRYKIGKFDFPVTARPGDRINLILTEPNGQKQKVSEGIAVTMTITHWVMFYVPGVGLGGMFGGPDMGERMDEIFVEPQYIKDGEMLIAKKRQPT
jgi:hypothetical protein